MDDIVEILTPDEFEELLYLDDCGGFNLQVDAAKNAYRKLYDETIGGEKDEIPE